MKTTSRPGGAVACAALFLVACSVDDDVHPSGPSSDLGPPNVLLISIDTLRPDHLSAYGYARQTSPRIDRLASEGALFENAISSSSWTLPAHAALFTGLADSVHGCDDSDRRLDDSRVTLAERFSALGYETVGFFAGPYLHPAFGLAQGFDAFVDCSSYAARSVELAASKGLDASEIQDASHRDITNPRVHAEVVRWLKARDGESSGTQGSRPFFMFVHLWDVHYDFIPPPPYDTMFDPGYEGDMTGEDFFRRPDVNATMPEADLQHIIALYDGEIAWTDEHVGRIVDDLEARGVLDRTIVMIVSDHGEEFFEHGGRGHRHTLHDELIRVPLILRYPAKVEAGTRIEEQVRLIDALPTLLDLAGAGEPEDVMGQSLTPLLRGEALRADNLAVSELRTAGRDMRSYRRPDRKRIDYRARGSSVVYDLTLDPEERLPGLVRPGSPDWKRSRTEDKAVGDDWLAKHRAWLPAAASKPELSAALVEQLSILGYVDDSD